MAAVVVDQQDPYLVNHLAWQNQKMLDHCHRSRAMIVCHNCFHRLSGLTMWTIDESEGHARRAHSSGMDGRTWCIGRDKHVPPKGKSEGHARRAR